MASKRAERLKQAFFNFDKLPDDAFVRAITVGELMAISPSMVWRLAHAGQLPQPHRLTRRTAAWRVGDLREHLRGGQQNA